MSTIRVVYDPNRGLYQEYGDPSFVFATGSTVTFDAPINYTPADPTNWRPVPGDLVQAVDYLADSTQPTSLVFDPNATASSNVFTDLDSLAAAVGRIKGKKVILFTDTAAATPYTIPNGVNGPYDFSDCEFLAHYALDPGFNVLTITFGAGVVFSKLPNKITGPARWHLPANFWTSSVLAVELILTNAIVSSTAGVTAGAALNVEPGHYLNLVLQNGAGLGGDITATAGLINADVASFGVGVALSEQASVTNYVMTGGGYIAVTFTDQVSGVANQTLPGWTGSTYYSTNFVAPINYDPSALTNTGNTLTTWGAAYGIASSQPGDGIIRCKGFTSSTNVPAGSYNMSNIILEGLPGNVLYISEGVTMSNSTRFKVRGDLRVFVSSSVIAPVFNYTNSSTRLFEFADRSRVVNESSVPFITASGGSIILMNVEGPRFAPVTEQGPFASLSVNSSMTFSGTRHMQSVISGSGVLVSLNMSSEAQLTCTTIGAGNALLADIEGNAYLRIPQFSTFIVEGIITARGRASGTTNSGIWSFRTVLTRDAASNTVAVVSGGGAATVVSAGPYGTPPNIAADTTNGGVAITCTGVGGVNAVFVANVKITASCTGA